MNSKPRRQTQRLNAILKMAGTLFVLAELILAPNAVIMSRAAPSQATLNVDIGFKGLTSIQDVVASSGAAPGSINLTWTEPERTGTTSPYSYLIHVSSTGEIPSDTAFSTAPALSVFSNSSPPTPGSGGGQAAMSVTGLVGGIKYCFAIKEQDSTSPTPLAGSWLSQGSWNPDNCAVATASIPAPLGLTIKAGLNQDSVSWQALTSAQTSTFQLAYYDLYRSTQSQANFVSIATTTSLSYFDYPLTPFTTYYYEVSAFMAGGAQSQISSQAQALPYTELPMEPAGIYVVPSSITVSMSWSPVTRFTGGALFVSTTNPSMGELEGYQILRSTQACTPNFVYLSSAPMAHPSFSDDTNGDNYYYQIRAYNSLGLSTSTLSISSLGDEDYYLSDCASEVVLSAAQTQSLRAATNGLGGDVVISRSFRPQDIGPSNPGILQSVQFVPLLNGTTPILGFALPQPAQIVVHYTTDSNGNPIPQNARTSASGESNLGMYWFNNVQYVKMYGTVNTFNQTLTVQSPNLGIYQIREQDRSTNGPVFDISNISGRIITPNGDGKNDIFMMTYDPGPDNVTPTGRIYDLRGGYVSDMTPGLVPNTITWDGTMHGRAVTSGVYIYQIKGGGKTFNGTVVVAK